MKKKIQNILKRPKKTDSAVTVREESEVVPRITNETVAEHREAVLSGARKYIYPLQHSKNRIVVLSSIIFVTIVMFFLSYCVFALYRSQSTSTFMYRVTQVLPFPIARAGRDFVAYENYLFELRHYIHYYENQQNVSLADESGKQQLDAYKERALDKVINDALVKKLAREQGITVSESDIDARIEVARSQNRLGGNDQVFEDVLREYWDWSVADYRRSLHAELLAQKLVAQLDTGAKGRIDEVMQALRAGTAFEEVVLAYSDDTITKEQGGDFGGIERSNRNVSSQTVDALFGLEPGEYSEPILIPYGTGYAYQVVKNIERLDDRIRGAHIIIQLRDINEFLNDYKEQSPVRLYVTL